MKFNIYFFFFKVLLPEWKCKLLYLQVLWNGHVRFDIYKMTSSRKCCVYRAVSSKSISCQLIINFTIKLWSRPVRRLLCSICFEKTLSGFPMWNAAQDDPLQMCFGIPCLWVISFLLISLKGGQINSAVNIDYHSIPYTFHIYPIWQNRVQVVTSRHTSRRHTGTFVSPLLLGKRTSSPTTHHGWGLLSGNNIFKIKYSILK